MPLKSIRHALPWAVLTTALLGAPSAFALEESDRLWRLGTNAFLDRLYPTAQQALERFIARSPADPRVPGAWLTLGKTQLALDDLARAAESFERALAFEPPPGRSQEARFWAAETLFRLKRYDEARVAYGAVIRADAASPLAPDAMYGLAVTELRLRRLESAIASGHPFTEKWERGELTRAQLAGWASQHYQYVSQFSRWCAAVYAECLYQDARDFLLENIIEEDSGTKHVELLIRFAVACGVSRSEVVNARQLPATRGLTAWCHETAHRPFHEAAAGLLVGLESQVPAISRRQLAPLKEPYGSGDSAATRRSRSTAGGTWVLTSFAWTR